MSVFSGAYSHLIGLIGIFRHNRTLYLFHRMFGMVYSWRSTLVTLPSESYYLIYYYIAHLANAFKELKVPPVYYLAKHPK